MDVLRKSAGASNYAAACLRNERADSQSCATNAISQSLFGQDIAIPQIIAFTLVSSSRVSNPDRQNRCEHKPDARKLACL